MASPEGVNTLRIETAQDMLKSAIETLPADICICAAAVSDWTAAEPQGQKIKKTKDKDVPSLSLKENPDILKTISNHTELRPKLVIGFAAETENVDQNAEAKLKRKGCDWILANAVGKDDNGVEKAFGTDENQIYFKTQSGNETWKRMSKQRIAEKLVEHIISELN